MVNDALEHPANRELRVHFAPGALPSHPAVERPADVDRPYETLGTHPDLVARLWDELTIQLPVDCRFVFLGRPVLIHPETAIVFGFAGGTHTYALRLPPTERAEAIAAGAMRVHTYPKHPPLDLATIGPEWVFGRWLADEARWCAAAYGYAGGVG